MTLDTTKAVTERVLGVGALVLAVLAPLLVSDFWLNSILTQALILGIGAASLIFLSAYGGMISLAQTGLMGIAGYALANMVTQRVPGGETKGLLLGWDRRSPSSSPFSSLSASGSYSAPSRRGASGFTSSCSRSRTR